MADTVKIVSNKTGLVQNMTEPEAKQHMKLHGRRFRNEGPAEEFTPEEAKDAAPATSKRRAVGQGSGPAEAEAPATSNQ